ncbi:FAD-dependent oxidoreductase [Sutcliffiella rhizosphaerae]|uniref:Kynurenine 3-monooxygenase n=1 Tax=Sutcliffiella rhizosphaerae TaxID=2880967 RepID=A0ABN8A614_9BACI|nr:NAD(P)/FAD-dependent oxidoreductase [Sutcliffiella rhizosphaerae]CAG9620505.1 Kynurenine 3-monooxygenase [Sutcliffiella rhizosphaerae]
MKANVLVIGGGVGGLTLALKLAKCGIGVTVVEQTKGTSHMYKGELVQPKTLQIFEHLGVLPSVQLSGHTINKIDLIEGNKQDTPSKSAMSYNILPKPYNYALMIPHETLKKILLDEASKFPSFKYIQPGRFTGFEQNKAKVKINKEEVLLQADYYISAEGRKSIIRDSLGIQKKEKQYDHHFLTVTFPRPASLKDGKIISTDETFLGLFPLPENQVRSVYLIPKGTYKEMVEEGIDSFYKKYLKLYPELDGYVQCIESWKKIQLMIPVHYHISDYVKGNVALLGDAAHSVHPMAGEGMNLAIQDADVLGELLCWMYDEDNHTGSYLSYYEEVRKPRVQYVLKLSHLSALAYSKPLKSFVNWRRKVIDQLTQDPVLHCKHMLNISGLGIWKESLVDRVIQSGVIPKRINREIELTENQLLFKETDDYPWKKEMYRDDR